MNNSMNPLLDQQSKETAKGVEERKPGCVTETSVTFYPASHPPEPFKPGSCPSDSKEQSPVTFFNRTYRKNDKKDYELLQTSLPHDSNQLEDMMPLKNGFVRTVLEAYNRHRALIIKPDDVWLAILLQFSFFVNGDSEALRKQFVSHEGKEKLVIQGVGNRYSANLGGMSRQMTSLMETKIVDPMLRDWIMAKFSTTTETDTTIYAMTMMCTMKNYFDYGFCLMCGIPQVTLEGTKGDWENILLRIEKLKEYGDHMTYCYKLLHPIISRFVTAYDNPDSLENLDFWNRVGHIYSQGSGPRYLEGWITAFCVFNHEGSRIGSADYSKTRKPLSLDGMEYPRIDSNDIPLGYGEVEVELDDNGKVFETIIVAGQVGLMVCNNNQTESMVKDTVRPLAAWWYMIIHPQNPTAE